MSLDYITDNIYLLNLVEIDRLCQKFDLPTMIYIRSEGRLKRTSARLHKSDLVKSILAHLRGHRIHRTVFSSAVVDLEPLRHPKPIDHLQFGQYSKKHSVPLLEKLTDGRFRDGYIARVMMFELWKKGRRFTYRSFARYYLKYYSKYERRAHPEWAYLADLKTENPKADFKKHRTTVARRVLSEIKKLTTRSTSATGSCSRRRC